MESDYCIHMDKVEPSELYNLMSEYGDDVWKYAYMITKNREQAKDIAQEVFIKAYYHLNTFRGQSSFKTWLFAITRNMAFNEMRSSYFRRILLFEDVKSDKNGESAEASFIGQQAVTDIWD